MRIALKTMMTTIALGAGALTLNACAEPYGYDSPYYASPSYGYSYSSPGYAYSQPYYSAPTYNYYSYSRPRYSPPPRPYRRDRDRRDDRDDRDRRGRDHDGRNS